MITLTILELIGWITLAFIAGGVITIWVIFKII